jgi:hypothetical protein
VACPREGFDFPRKSVIFIIWTVLLPPAWEPSKPEFVKYLQRLHLLFTTLLPFVLFFTFPLRFFLVLLLLLNFSSNMQIADLLNLMVFIFSALLGQIGLYMVFDIVFKIVAGI